ncbi:MAG: sugar phosphate isomerase/epimerase family protein [Cyclobacteriaceae bacterium]
MKKRREFLKNTILAGASLSLSIPFTLSAAVKNKDNIGIITNTVGNELKQDFKGTMQKLADIGYKCIEGAVPEGVTTDEYKKVLQSFGLRSIATGSSMGSLQKELDKYLKTAEALGAEYLVCYYPWLSSATDLKIDEVMETAERINEIGKKVKEAGFRFAWHNHAKEFVDVEGKLAFDIIMENTDPKLSTVELDWYWVVKGGYDPVDYFKKYPGRFELAHVKDMNNNQDGSISCVGQGIIDFAPMFDASALGGVKYFILENEKSVKGIDCANVSFKTISNYLS